MSLPLRLRTVRFAVLGALISTVAGMSFLVWVFEDGSIQSSSDWMALMRNPAARGEVIILAIPLAALGATVATVLAVRRGQLARREGSN
jgi:hypothetical protein